MTSNLFCLVQDPNTWACSHWVEKSQYSSSDFRPRKHTNGLFTGFSQHSLVHYWYQYYVSTWCVLESISTTLSIANNCILMTFVKKCTPSLKMHPSTFKGASLRKTGIKTLPEGTWSYPRNTKKPSNTGLFIVSKITLLNGRSDWTWTSGLYVPSKFLNAAFLLTPTQPYF
jgi:hypothetical protein